MKVFNEKGELIGILKGSEFFKAREVTTLTISPEYKATTKLTIEEGITLALRNGMVKNRDRENYSTIAREIAPIFDFRWQSVQSTIHRMVKQGKLVLSTSYKV